MMRFDWTALIGSNIQCTGSNGINLKAEEKGLSYEAGKLFALTAILAIFANALITAEANELEAELREGGLITYIYNVSNIGDVNLTNIKVTDDRATPIYVSGDVNDDRWLNLSEVWTYKATYRVKKSDLAGNITNIANATALDPCGKPVNDQDILVVKTPTKDGEPIQYGQFCEAQKISGTGVIDASTFIRDRNVALDYYNMMTGMGDIELDQENAYSENADKLKRSIDSVNGSNLSTLNLYDNTKLTYSGLDPLQGEKFIHSDALYGGIGAQVRETFSVQEMEKDEVSFLAQTMPYRPRDGLKNFRKGLSEAGRDIAKVNKLMITKEGISNPAFLVGIQARNTFNGTWGTDASWHKIFYKDLNAHEMFSGSFEVEKQIKFHRYPAKENETSSCNGIDC